MERIGIFLLHGFLGKASDWQKVIEKIPRISDLEKIKVEFVTLDYFQEPSLSPRVGLALWGKAFNQFVESKKMNRNILVGYSLGGRLGMQALQQAPSLWTRALLISANAGFADLASSERAERLTTDKEWAQRFQSEDWIQVLNAWNAQPVFAGSMAEPMRNQADYNRQHLGEALVSWSLAKQPDMRSILNAQAAKITWMTGRLDVKFAAQAELLKKSISNFEVVSVNGASHRIPFDQPQAIADWVVHNSK